MAGETVRFVVRPEKLALRSEPIPGEETLPVTVVDRVYHGASTEWIVEDGQGERFTVLAQNAGVDLPFLPGSPALLVWGARNAVVLRR
jgi:hypothetical protein